MGWYWDWRTDGFADAGNNYCISGDNGSTYPSATVALVEVPIRNHYIFRVPHEKNNLRLGFLQAFFGGGCMGDEYCRAAVLASSLLVQHWPDSPHAVAPAVDNVGTCVISWLPPH